MSDKNKEKKQGFLKSFFAQIRTKKTKKDEEEYKINKEAERIFVKLYPQHKDKHRDNMSAIRHDDPKEKKDDWENLLRQVRETRKNKTYTPRK